MRGGAGAGQTTRRTCCCCRLQWMFLVSMQEPHHHHPSKTSRTHLPVVRIHMSQLSNLPSFAALELGSLTTCSTCPRCPSASSWCLGSASPPRAPTPSSPVGLWTCSKMWVGCFLVSPAGRENARPGRGGGGARSHVQGVLGLGFRRQRG